ncbi:hypothetical protein GA830_00215 [Mesorhizobium sp. NBSH29]|uniref:hypothetical protein n=1 Tax=Mesorhizobium sp. NBSH29 TaxID=2654249 RepID=UPI0018968046|nr:hypothetical protein [Mesorhizobium sp. NBSH29]QPC85336.1 hypothetical protein GA830_00215 [Mesorhizobium sp. NBSH29]
MSDFRTRFLNADLDLAGKQKLDGLVEALTSLGFYTLDDDDSDDASAESELFEARFELDDDSVDFDDPAAVVDAIVTRIEKLSGDALAQWKGLELATIDNGFEVISGDEGRTFTFAPALVARCAALGLTLAVTIYSGDGEDGLDEDEIDDGGEDKLN